MHLNAKKFFFNTVNRGHSYAYISNKNMFLYKNYMIH